MTQFSKDKNNISIKNENTSSELSLEEINYSFNKFGKCFKKKEIQIFLAGDFGVGKTCLFRRFIDGTYEETDRCTIGAEYYTKDYEIDNETTVIVKLVDISGCELYLNKTLSLFKGSVGCILVFDVTRLESFNKIEEWKKDINEKVRVSENRPIPCILVGNKIDRCKDHKRVKSKEEIERFILQKNFIKYFEISVKEQTDFDELFKYLINYIIDNNIEPFVNENEDENVETESNSNCSLS